MRYFVTGGAQNSVLQSIESADVVRPGERSCESAGDVHPATTVWAPKWLVLGSVRFLLVILLRLLRRARRIE